MRYDDSTALDYDDQLRLTHVAVRAEGLTLELEYHIRLMFTGVPRVSEEELDHADHLVLDGFERLLVQWRDSEGTDFHSSQYTGGKVTLGFFRGGGSR